MPPARISTRRTVPRISQIPRGLCKITLKSKPCTFKNLKTLHALVSKDELEIEVEGKIIFRQMRTALKYYFLTSKFKA
jgi:hypothetical protein